MPLARMPPQADSFGDFRAVDVEVGVHDEKLLRIALFGADDAAFDLGQFQTGELVWDAGFGCDVGRKRGADQVGNDASRQGEFDPILLERDGDLTAADEEPAG